MLSPQAAVLVWRIALNCLRGGNHERAQAHLRQLREDGYQVLAYRLCTKMIVAGITPCDETKSRPTESLETSP